MLLLYGDLTEMISSKNFNVEYLNVLQMQQNVPQYYASSTLLPNILFHGTICFGIDPYSRFALGAVIASR
jgi:hypothetical protein